MCVRCGDPVWHWRLSNVDMTDVCSDIESALPGQFF